MENNNRGEPRKDNCEGMVYGSEVTLEKELVIADKLADVLLGALKDKKQFNRYLIKGKECTDEMIFKKVDIDSLNNAIKALKSLEEIKIAMQEVVSPESKETRQDTGVVFLPEVKEENNEA